MVSILRKQGGVLFVACLVVVAFVAKFVLSGSASAAGGGDEKVAMKSAGGGGGGGDASNPIPDAALQAVLLRMSLSPESMAAAGLSSNNVTSVVTVVKNYIASYPTELTSADATFQTARTTADAKERLVKSGLGSQDDISSLATAQQTLASATSARQTILDTLFANVIANLSEAQRTTLTNIRANAAWRLPAEYLVSNRSESSWVQLRDALSVKRIALKNNEALDSPTQQYLAGVDAEVAIAAAKTASATGLGSVTSTWNTATAKP